MPTWPQRFAQVVKNKRNIVLGWINNVKYSSKCRLSKGIVFELNRSV